jgi:hypothetical protein
MQVGLLVGFIYLNSDSIHCCRVKAVEQQVASLPAKVHWCTSHRQDIGLEMSDHNPPDWYEQQNMDGGKKASINFSSRRV